MQNEKSSSDQDQVKFIRNGLSFTIVLGGIHKIIQAKDEQDAEYLQYLLSKSDEPEFYDELLERISPSKNLQNRGILDKDEEGNNILKQSRAKVSPKLARLISDYARNNNSYDSIINFAELLYLNPLKDVRDRLYDFIEKNGIVITEEGYLVLYKSVKQLPDMEQSLSKFIATTIYEKIINGEVISGYHVFKKDPNRETKNPFIICDDEIYEAIIILQSFSEQLEDKEKDNLSKKIEDSIGGLDLEKLEYQGNLDELYKRMADYGDAEFTDFFNGSTRIKLGKIINLDLDECDFDSSTPCSAGLHAGSFSYVESYGGSDKSIIAVLVNPMNIVAVPEADKLRTSEYLPFAVLTKNDEGEYQELRRSLVPNDYLTREKELLNSYRQIYEYQDDDHERNVTETITKRINDLEE